MREILKITSQTSQRGSATIIALIVVSLVAICLTSLFWQQNFEIRKTIIFKENTQIAWLQRSLIDVVRLVLRIDLLNDSKTDHLGEVWALPIENSRIEDYSASLDLPEELKNIRFSGFIQDAQGLFNIANLWDANLSKPNMIGIQIYARLLQQLGEDKNLAEQTSRFVISRNFKPQYLDDLIQIPGYSQSTLNKLKNVAIFLPEPTAINVNTTRAEVLLAIIPNFSQADVERFILLRGQSPLTNQDDINKLLSKIQPNRITSESNLMTVRSNYWLAHTNLLIDQRNINAQTLIKRFTTPQGDRNFTTVLWTKQKIIQNK
jgi:general secretion pathway protein K